MRNKSTNGEELVGNGHNGAGVSLSVKSASEGGSGDSGVREEGGVGKKLWNCGNRYQRTMRWTVAATCGRVLWPTSPVSALTQEGLPGGALGSCSGAPGRGPTAAVPPGALYLDLKRGRTPIRSGLCVEEPSCAFLHPNPLPKKWFFSVTPSTVAFSIFHVDFFGHTADPRYLVLSWS